MLKYIFILNLKNIYIYIYKHINFFLEGIHIHFYSFFFFLFFFLKLKAENTWDTFNTLNDDYLGNTYSYFEQ